MTFPFLIDAEDAEWPGNLRWRISTNRYVVRNIKIGSKWTIEYLHRRIMNAQPGELIDHVNGDTLDNRRCNLRKCDRSSNAANQRRAGYKGTYFSQGRWNAHIRLHRKNYFIGGFVSQEEAARAYDMAARHLFGQFACTNFPGEEAAHPYEIRLRRASEGKCRKLRRDVRPMLDEIIPGRWSIHGPTSVLPVNELFTFGHVGRSRVSRIVTLADYQGVGIGTKVMEVCSRLYKAETGRRINIGRIAPVDQVALRPVATVGLARAQADGVRQEPKGR